jgi:hypothetical protein
VDANLYVDKLQAQQRPKRFKPRFGGSGLAGTKGSRN